MNFDMDSSLGFILNKTSLASKTAFNTLIKPYGISPEQWSVIFRVARNEGISQKMLADSTYKDQGNLTRMIDKLVEKGFMVKSADEADRRAYKLHPTQKALDLVEKVAPLSTLHNERLTKDFTEDEISILMELLNKVYNNLQKEQ